MTTMRNSRTGTIWHYHSGYARTTCKHRTEWAMRQCAIRTERRRQRDEEEERRERPVS